jgi:hypothetical protein
MKILFVTGDHNCECGGSGKVTKQHSVSINGVLFTIVVKEVCDCVKAMDATLRHFDDKMDADTTTGRVVPDE